MRGRDTRTSTPSTGPREADLASYTTAPRGAAGALQPDERGLQTLPPATARTATMVLVGREPAVGWHQNPGDATTFRYWNGREWTARAQSHIDPRGIAFLSAQVQGKRRRVLDSRLVRNPMTFHVVAWFDCSVPLTRGRLRRFTRPVEFRTLGQVRGFRTRN